MEPLPNEIEVNFYFYIFVLFVYLLKWSFLVKDIVTVIFILLMNTSSTWLSFATSNIRTLDRYYRYCPTNNHSKMKKNGANGVWSNPWLFNCCFHCSYQGTCCFFFHIIMVQKKTRCLLNKTIVDRIDVIRLRIKQQTWMFLGLPYYLWNKDCILFIWPLITSHRV